MSELRKHVERGCRKRKKPIVPEVTTKRHKEKKDKEYVINNISGVGISNTSSLCVFTIRQVFKFFFRSSELIDAASGMMDEDVKIIERSEDVKIIERSDC